MRLAIGIPNGGQRPTQTRLPSPLAGSRQARRRAAAQHAPSARGHRRRAAHGPRQHLNGRAIVPATRRAGGARRQAADTTDRPAHGAAGRGRGRCGWAGEPFRLQRVQPPRVPLGRGPHAAVIGPVRRATHLRLRRDGASAASTFLPPQYLSTST